MLPVPWAMVRFIFIFQDNAHQPLKTGLNQVLLVL